MSPSVTCEHCRTIGQHLQSTTRSAPTSANVGRIGPNSGQHRANVGRRRPNLVELDPDLGRVGPDLAELGSMLFNIGSTLVDIGRDSAHSGPDFVDAGPNLAGPGRNSPCQGAMVRIARAPPSFRKDHCTTQRGLASKVVATCWASAPEAGKRGSASCSDERKSDSAVSAAAAFFS